MGSSQGRSCGHGQVFPRTGIGTGSRMQLAYQEVMSLLRRLYPSHSRAWGLFEEAFLQNDLNFGESEALAWAGNYRIPEEVLGGFNKDFEAVDCDMPRFIMSLKDSIRGVRLSVQSIGINVSPDNPDRGKLMALVEGMNLCPAPDFVPNGPDNLPKLSSTYKRLATAVNRMIVQNFVNNQLAFILSKDLVNRSGIPYHLSQLSWTVKFGKKEGRPIHDGSAGQMPVNSEFTKTSYDKIWGVIRHPSIGDLVRMVLDYRGTVLAHDPSIRMCDFVLWKVDLKGAYTLLSFATEAIPNMAAELDDGNLIFFMCGVFGFTGTPAAFQVVSRVIKFEVNRLITGRMDIYVDDMFGISLRVHVDKDVEIASAFCRSLFNSNCIEDTKTEKGERVGVIGYVIDINVERVSVARKNYLKVIYGLSSIDLEGRIPVKVLQRFASWLSRYSLICPVLKPLSKAIYNSFKQRYKYEKVELGTSALIAIRMFRAMFLLSVIDESKFARTLISFRRRCEPDYIVEFDASLEGCGIILYSLENGLEVHMGAFSFSIAQLRFGEDSSFQNTAEFVAGVVGLVILSKIGKRDSFVSFRGDSRSALSWLEEGKFRSNVITRAAFLYVHICTSCEYVILESSYLSSAMNYRADYLSRNSIRNEANLSVIVKELIEFLNPHEPFAGDMDCVAFWTELPVVVDRFLYSLPSPQ